MIDIETGLPVEPTDPERAEALAFRETFDVREHLQHQVNKAAVENAALRAIDPDEKQQLEGIIAVQKAQLASCEEHIAALRSERDALLRELATKEKKSAD